MEEQDLKKIKEKEFNKIKDKYGEKFAQFCRSNFPKISEYTSLSDFISNLMYPTKALYDDIVEQGAEASFVAYVNTAFEKVNNIQVATKEYVPENPFELIRKKNYTLYKCETNEDIQKFKKYYKKNEEICTFKQPNRINESLVFFAIKDGATVDGINGKKRKDFIRPMRQDEYGTSVISIQFTKGSYNRLKIISRYNHTVVDTDATYSNDLENIVAGLTESFAREYSLNLVAKNGIFPLAGYVLGNDRKLYRYNVNIDGTYYCNNNIVITNGEPYQYNPDKYELFDNFLLRRVSNEVINLARYSDSFADTANGFVKNSVFKSNNNRIILLEFLDGSTAEIGLGKNNQIISYNNENITEIGDNFLLHNTTATRVNLPNVKTIKNKFMQKNSSMTSLTLDNVTQIGDDFMEDNNSLKIFIANKLEKLGKNLLFYNTCLSLMRAQNLTHLPKRFLYCNNDMLSLDLPSVVDVEDYFMPTNEGLVVLNAPKLTSVGRFFLNENTELRELNAPIKNVGSNFLNINKNFDALKDTLRVRSRR